MWLLAVEPTIATSHLAPEHGDWTIRTDGLKPGARLHAYVARSDPNMDAHTGARRSYFVDAGWESRSGAAAGCTYVDGKFAKAGSLIHRHGTLNGIATDYVPSIHVEVVRMLIAAGAPLDHVNNLKWTALIESIVLGDGGRNHTETLRALVEAGADVNIPDGRGATPLALAKSRGYREMVAILEKAGAK